MNKVRIKYLCLIIGITFTFSNCENLPKTIPDHEVASQWADMTLFITQNTPANSPTFASRCLGYLGLAQYESVVHSDSTYLSLTGQLTDLQFLPLPNPELEYKWPLVLNSAQSELLKSIYQQTSEENKKKIDSLEDRIHKIIVQSTPKTIAERSKNYGMQIGKAIFEWSKTDGGHRGYLKNFDPNYKQKEFLGSWKPPLFAQSFSHHPLHPYWGTNRSFSPKNNILKNPTFITFDSLPGSAYYEQFYAVYKKEKVLTQKEKETAIWWSDDPDVTFSPGGHLYFITNALVRKTHPTLIQATKAFAMVGMSVADAFISCWKWKYIYFSERPNTFITKYIDKKWESFWPDPPFPSFPSGHAIQASAAAVALSENFNKNSHLIDSAHVGRERDRVRNTDFIAREYNSLWEIAEETAQSRFFGGIHTEQDNQVGLEQGAIIAKNIATLRWKR